jgi:hypothetical protein
MVGTCSANNTRRRIVMSKINWSKKATSTVVKEDMKKYITPGEKSKLEYPAPPKQKVLETMTKGEEGDLQFKPKKASDTFSFKEKDVITPGEKGKLEHGKRVKWPTEGDVKSQDISSIAKPYMSKGEPGDIQKAKSFSSGDGANSDTMKFEDNKYRMAWDKAKPIQKQFSKKSHELSDWMDELRERGYDRRARRAFRYAWITASKEGKDPVKVASAALENYEATDTMEDSGSAYLPEVVGFVLTSFLKFAKECPKCLNQLLETVDTYQYYPAMDELNKKDELKTSEAKKVSAASIEELEKQRDEMQKQLAEIQKQIAEAAQKIAEGQPPVA